MNVIFDFSGTLAEDKHLAYLLTADTLKILGGPDLSLAEYLAEFSLPAAPFYKRFLPQIAFEKVESVYAELCRSLYPQEITWIAGLPALLRGLSYRHRFFLFSTVDGMAIEACLEKENLRWAFQAVRGQVGDKTKSLPQFIKDLGLHPDETVYVGDTPHDMQAAAAAGIAGWGVTWGHGPQVAMQKTAESVIQSVEELNFRLLKTECVEARVFPIVTVGGVLVDDQRNILLVRTRKWLNHFGIPGGKVDYGETLEQAFRREIMEETGLVVEEVHFVMNQNCIEHVQFYRKRHFVLVNYWAKVPGSKPVVKLNHEAVEWCWTSIEDALAMELNEPTRVLIECLHNQAGF